MKQIITFAFVLWINISKAQSLLLSPELSPSTQLRHPVNGYMHSNLTNSSILNFSVADGVPTIQSLTNSSIGFTVNDGSGLMWLNPQGYLSLGSGIGTERLDIKKGRVRFTGQKAAGQPSGYVFTDMSGTPAFRLEMKDDDHLRIMDVNGVENFIMNVNTGNVGINTAPTAEALTVAGSVHSTQLESVTAVANPVLLSVYAGDLTKGEMNKAVVTPWNYTRFGGVGNTNFTINSGLGFYTTNGNYVELSAPLHIPNGVALKNIKVNIIDNSPTSYIQINFLGIANDGTTTSVRTLSSKNNPTSSFLTELSDFLNTTTDCAALYYIISVRVQKNSDDTSAMWPGANLKLGTITITYAY